MQVWAAAWRSLEPPALEPTHLAARHGVGASSMQGAGKRGRRGGAVERERRAGGRDRALAKGPAADGVPGHDRGPRLALQGVAARPRAQLLALALVALEQGVAALPPSTLRCLPRWLSDCESMRGRPQRAQGVAALPPSTLRQGLPGWSALSIVLMCGRSQADSAAAACMCQYDMPLEPSIFLYSRDFTRL